MEKPIEDPSERTNQNDDRAKQYARLILFALAVVVIWYTLDLANI